jgi:hypothetical protein
MKRFIYVTLLVVIFIVATTGLVSANSQSVTVTANPKVFVSGLTATYITDYEIGLSWLMAENVTNVMIRAKCGGVPANRDDGFLVYYGNSTNTTHFLEQSLALYLEPLYYVLWSQNGDGSWNEIESSAEGNFMSISVLFLSMVSLVLGLSLAWVWKRQGLFAYAAAGFWLFLGLMAYQTSTSPSPLEMTDIYMGLFWVCMGMVITFVLLPTLMREKPVSSDIAVDEWEGEDMSSFGISEKKQETKFQPRKLRSRFGDTGVI